MGACVGACVGACLACPQPFWFKCCALVVLVAGDAHPVCAGRCGAPTLGALASAPRPLQPVR
eukprot:5940782-Lingulodinium_polyedra.AAC.1